MIPAMIPDRRPFVSSLMTSETQPTSSVTSRVPVKTSGPLSERDQLQNIVERVPNGSQHSPGLITDHGYPDTISDMPSGTGRDDSANGSMSGDKQLQKTTELSPDSTGRSPGICEQDNPSTKISNSLLKDLEEPGPGLPSGDHQLSNRIEKVPTGTECSPGLGDCGKLPHVSEVLVSHKSVSEEIQNIMRSSRNDSASSTKANDNGPPLSLSDISVHIIEDDVREQSEDQLLKVGEDFPTTPRCSPSDTPIHKTDDSNDRQRSEVEFRSPGPDDRITISSQIPSRTTQLS